MKPAEGESVRFRVAADEGGRLDRILTSRFPGVGRRRWAELFAAGWVRIDGVQAKKGDRVAPGAEVTVRAAPPVGGELAPVPEPDRALEVIHQDARLVAMTKPAGQPSHPLRPGETGTLANALVARFPECAAVGRDAREAGLVHRLDRGTSGAIVAARDMEAYRGARRAFAAGEVDKSYLALVAGRARDGELDAALIQRGRRSVLVHDATPGALSAMTAWRVLSIAAEVSLLAVSAHTGRMHQVRAHLAAAGHPLIGDPLYGGPPSVNAAGDKVALEHPFLHARALSLPHPDGERLSVEAPLPEDRRAILEQLGLSIRPLP